MGYLSYCKHLHMYRCVYSNWKKFLFPVLTYKINKVRTRWLSTCLGASGRHLASLAAINTSWLQNLQRRTGYLWACPVKVTCDCSLWTFSEAKGSHWQRSSSLQLVCMKYRGYTYKWHKLLRNNIAKFTLVPYLENKDFLSTSRSESLTDALYCTSGWGRKTILSVHQKLTNNILPPPFIHSSIDLMLHLPFPFSLFAVEMCAA